MPATHYAVSNPVPTAAFQGGTSLAGVSGLRPKLSQQDRIDMGDQFRRLGMLPPSEGTMQPILQEALDVHNNLTPAGKAAALFQAQWQEQVLASPGSILVSRTQLGLTQHDLAMIDMGGEGQKTTLEFGETLKTGNVHAINVNAQTFISSTPLNITLEPGRSAVPILSGHIPNLIRPAKDWPSSGDPPLTLPLATGFSNLTLMEGCPLSANSVVEMNRITSRKGWLALKVDSSFADKVAQLATLHSGGKQWVYAPQDSSTEFPTHVLPPRGLTSEQTRKYAARFDGVTAHELFDVVRKIQAERSVPVSGTTQAQRDRKALRHVEL